MFDRVAIIYDDTIRPDTTGTYCCAALQTLTNVQHVRPDEFDSLGHSQFDLFINIDDGLHYRLPKGMRPAAWWAIDTHLESKRYLEKAHDFDLVFTAQRDAVELLQNDCHIDVHWLPLACDPAIHRRYDLPKQFDLCFVGNLIRGVRSDLISFAKQHFDSFFVGKRYFEEMAKTYSASRIALNRSIKNDINMRVFESMACGPLLVTNDLSENGQDELFQDGVHLATYQEEEEFRDKVNFYLKHDEIRQKVAAAGQQETLSKHTYIHRMRTILEHAQRHLSPTKIYGPQKTSFWRVDELRRQHPRKSVASNA